MIHGKELIGTEPLEVMHQQACTQAYDAEKDVEFYANNFEGTDQLLTDGNTGFSCRKMAICRISV